MRVLNFGVFLERAITDVFAILIEYLWNIARCFLLFPLVWAKKREMRIAKELEYLNK